MHELFSPGKINIIPCRTFSGLFDMVGGDPSLIGIVAVENSLAGSILPNLTLLRDSQVTITQGNVQAQNRNEPSGASRDNQ
ncbi:MAG: hypothetical protein MZV63_57285 [Marinilabiliales bacterium]|nr:hypothetical protein [Marinilabiliales bacterium]